MIWELLSIKYFSIDLIINRRKKFPSSGEMNFKVANPERCLQEIYKIYASNALVVDRKDGISILFENWRFNIRKSNTEPLIRLNVETKENENLLVEKTQELSRLILAN